MSIIKYNRFMYLRARTKEQIDERRKEIIEAMDSLYINNELSNIYLKDIAAKTNISRTAIYSYYDSKEEILLDSLYNHFISLDDSMSLLLDQDSNKDEIIDKISSLFEQNIIILKIMSTDLEKIEKSTTLDNLVTLKKELKRFQDILKSICRKINKDTKEDKLNNIMIIFITMLYGFYPLAYPIDIQKEAMKLTSTSIDISLKDLITTSLTYLFNNLMDD